MAGIVFLRTADLETLVDFYTARVGMEIWLEQPDCTLLRHGNLLLGFCRGEAETQGCLTFYYPSAADVDRCYERLRGTARDEPRTNERYRIYNFFASDPEGRVVECQAFLHPVPQFPGAIDLLRTRRSVRSYRPDPVDDEVLAAVFASCRWAPTSNGSESYSFAVTRDPERIARLAGLRGSASAPLGRAPCAVAVCSDLGKPGGAVNGTIAAYHFLLAAWVHGLGTCWIGSMDRPEAREAFAVEENHAISCVTPLGWPDEAPSPGERRPAADLYRVV